jgi:hypothetical protein
MGAGSAAVTVLCDLLRLDVITRLLSFTITTEYVDLLAVLEITHMRCQYLR